MEGGDPFALLISELWALRWTAIFYAAGATVFIWDYILTFQMEVDLVWKSKWTFMKGLYFFQRYLPFIDTTLLALYVRLGENLTKTVCAKVYPPLAVLTLVGFAASEMLLTLRTWATWNRNQVLSIVLPIIYTFVWGSGFVALGVFLKSVTFGDPQFPGSRGCFVTHANDIGILFLWGQLIVWDSVMLMLMLVPGIRAYRGGGNSALVKSVYRDGVIYYLYLFSFSFLNILLVRFLPSQYRHLLTGIARVLHSILASRVLLHIRAQAAWNAGDGLTEPTQLKFRHVTENESQS